MHAGFYAGIVYDMTPAIAFGRSISFAPTRSIDTGAPIISGSADFQLLRPPLDDLQESTSLVQALGQGAHVWKLTKGRTHESPRLNLWSQLFQM